VTTVAALTLTGYLALAALLVAAVAVPAIVAGVAAESARRTVLLALPVVVAVALVAGLTRPGSTVLIVLGPFDVTAEGLDFAARMSLRLVVMAAALVLLGLTMPVRALVADLERRGAPQRLTYAVAATLDTVPAMLERGRAIRDAQRARGLDTEGSVGARLRGVLPLAGPAVLGAIHDVEPRTLALETRGFGRPGRRHLLWAPPDRDAERVLRWALIAALVALTAGTATGVIPPLP
jgi:energy-coupling factor transport system permease protein